MLLYMQNTGWNCHPIEDAHFFLLIPVSVASSPQIVEDENLLLPNETCLIFSSGGTEKPATASKAAGFLLIPRYEFQSDSVSGCCAICSKTYQMGDIVTWSTNKDCDHCFHSACLADCFLSKSIAITGIKTTLFCPICRRAFQTIII